MLSPKNRNSWGFSFKKGICYFLILNHIWLGCAQATYSITGLSDAETQAEEFAWKHLAQRRVQIDSVPLSDDPDSTLSGLRLRAFKTQYHPDFVKEQETDLESKTQILQQETEFDLLQTILHPSSIADLLPDMTPHDRGVSWNIGGLDLFVTWEGKVEVRGGKADSLSLETSRSIKFLEAVSAHSLTLIADHCSVRAPLLVEQELDIVINNPLKGFTIRSSDQGRESILQAKNITVHEGSLEIHKGATLSLEPGGILNLNHNDLLNYDLLEALEEGSIENISTLHNRGSITGHRLHLQGQTLKNEEEGTLQSHHLTMVLNNLYNDGQILSPKHIELGIADRLDNTGEIASKGSLAVKGTGTLLNSGTLQSGKDGKLSLETNKAVNTRLIQANGDLLINPVEEFLNEQGGWVHALGLTEIRGKGTLMNRSHRIEGEYWLNPDLEGAGFSPEDALWFHAFQGKVINEGSWATQGKVSGFLARLENTGNWRAGIMELEIANFLNRFSEGVTGGLVDAPGFWKIHTGRNGSIFQGESLHMQVGEKFSQSERGAVKTENLLKIDGEGYLNLKGRVLSNREIFLDAKEIEMSSHVHSPKITIGEKVYRWVRHTVGDWIFKTLSLLGSQTLGLNEGLLEGDGLESYGRLDNEGTIRFNKAEMKAGSLKNKPGGDIDLGESNFMMDSLINNSTLTLNKKMTATIRKTSNTDCLTLLQDGYFTGDSFTNTGTIKGDSLDLTMTQELSQLKTMTAKRKLSLEAPQIISDLNSETTSEQNLSVKTEKPLVSQGLWKGKKSFDLKTPAWVNKGVIESPRETDIIVGGGDLTNDHEMTLNGLSLSLKPGKSLLNQHKLTIAGIEALSPHMNIKNTGTLQIQLTAQDKPALLVMEEREKPVASRASKDPLNTSKFSGINAKGARGSLDLETGLVYPAAKTQISSDIFLPKEYQMSKDPMDSLLWNEIRNYAAEMNSAIQRDSSIWKESIFLLDPLCYIVRNELRSFLWDVEHSRNYAPDTRKDYAPYTRFTVEQKIQNLAARHLKKIGELKLGPLTDASFTTLMGDVETLNCGGYHKPWGFGRRFVPYEEIGIIPLGQRFAQWDKDRGITKRLVPRLINEGLNFLKNTREWFGKEGYPYALTQNVKGNIAVSSPYVPLVYPLFSNERLQGEAYIPKTFRHDERNTYLWQDIHSYIDENLDKSKNKEGTFLGLSRNHAVYHLDPLFYVTRQAVMFSDGRSKRDVAEQLQNAFAYHLFMTPLYTKDRNGEISKVLTLRLLDKGFALFRDGSLKWLRLSEMKNENQLILSGGTWHPENLVNSQGSMIQLGRGTSLHYPSVRNDGIIKGLDSLEIEGDDNVQNIWSLQSGKDLILKLSDKVDAAKILKDYRKYWKLNGTLSLEVPWFHHTDPNTVLPYPLRIVTQDFLNVGKLKAPGMEFGGGGRFRNGLLSQQRWGELLSTDFMTVNMYSLDNGWGRIKSHGAMTLHALGGNIENGALFKITKTSFPAPYHIPYSRYGSGHHSSISDLIRGEKWTQGYGETPVQVHHGNQALITSNDLLTLIADQGNIHNDYGNIYSGSKMIAVYPQGKFRTLAGNLWVNGDADIMGQAWSLQRAPGESYRYEDVWITPGKGKRDVQKTNTIHLDTSDSSSAKILGNLFLQVNDALIDGSSLLVGGQIYSDGKNPLNLQDLSSSFKVKSSHGGKPSVVMSKQKILINTGDFGLEGYREVGGHPVTQTIIIDLAEMAKAMMKQNPLIQIQKKKGLPRLTLGGESAEGNDPYRMMFDSQSPRGIPYLDAQVFQHVLMDVLASYAGTLSLKSVQELNWEGQTRALFRQGQKIAQKKQGALTEKDLKGLETSALVLKKQTIDGIDYEVAQFVLNPKDLNPLGNNNTTMTAPSVKIMTHQSDIKNATVVGTENKVSLKVSGKSHMMGTLYGEKKVKHQADVMILERPVERWLEEVTEKQTTSGMFSSNTKETKRIIERMNVLTGGRTLTGEEGGVYLDARQLFSIGSTTKAGKKGINVHTSELFDDRPLIEVIWDKYHIEKNGTFGGGYEEEGYVSREVLHRSSWISKGSIVMEHDGKASYGAPLIKTTEGDVSIVAKKELSVPGVKAKQEDTPTLSENGTKIEKTIGSREIGEIMRIEALRKIRLESGEQISGVRPHMISQTQEIKAPKISIMEEIDFRKTLKRDQQTFVVGSTVDPGLMLVMSAAITAVTAGAGSVSLGAAFASAMGIAETSAVTFAMVSAGANAIANQAILSGILNKGNLGEVVKEITSADSLKSLGITMATAGLGEQFGIKAPGGKSGFEKHLQYQAKKALIDNTFKVALKGENIKEAIKNAGMQVIVNSFASYGAQKIGATFDPEKSVEDYLSHKTMHGMLGGLTGFALEGDIKGAVSGAMGAVVAEVMAEQMVDRNALKLKIEKQALKEGWIHDEDAIEMAFHKKLQSTMDKAKLITGTIALISGQNVDVALQTALNALENNFKNQTTGKALEEIKEKTQEIREQIQQIQMENAYEEGQKRQQWVERKIREQRETELGIIQENREFDPSWDMDRVGYEIAKDPRQAQETLEMAHLMAQLYPLYGRAFGLYDAGAGYLSGEYSGKMAMAMAGMEFMPNKAVNKAEKITHSLSKKIKNIGKGFSEGIKQLEKRTIHNNPLAKKNIGKAKLEQKIQTAHPLKKGVDNPSDTIRGLDLADFGQSSINAKIAMNKKLSALQKAQIKSVKTAELPDGRIRYYAAEREAKTEGLTRGSSYVTEYNPKTGKIKSWIENYDHGGQVIRVHPKMVNGQDLNALHFPLTGKELEMLAKLKK